MTAISKLQLVIDIKEKLNTGLNRVKQKIDNTIGTVQRKLQTMSGSTLKAFEAIGSQVPFIGEAIGMLTNPYAAAAAATTALATGIALATQKAIEWRTQMAEINVTAEKTPQELAALSDKMLEIGGRNVASLSEVPKAYNDIISAIGDADISLAALEPTLRAAKAGFSETSVAADAMTNIMGATGIQDATKIYDVLFATMKSGKASFGDIANYLPKIIPSARNLGFTFEEVSGAYANLTKTLKPEAAATALENVFASLGNADTVKKFEKIGVKIFDDKGKARPLLQVFKDLNNQMQGLTDKQKMLKFDQLGLDQQASRAFALLSADMPGIAKDIQDVADSQGALNKAYQDAASPLDSWKIAINKAEVAIIKIGEVFMPFVEMAGEKMLDFINYWKDLYNNSLLFQDFISGIGDIISVAMNIAYKPLITTINIFKFMYNLISGIITGIGNWIAKLAGLKGGFAEMYNNIRPYLLYIKQFLEQIGDIMYDIFTFNHKGAYNKIAGFKMPDLNAIRKAMPTVKVEAPATPKKTPTPPTLREDTGNNREAPSTPAGGTQLTEGAKGIKGDSQARNITINIDSFIKGGINPTHTSINSMDKYELERWLTEMFMRVVRSAEVTY